MKIEMEADRLNSPSTSVITFEVLGHQLQFSQDPNSKHLGTTVWDTSMVFAKFLEKNCRKGRFCPSKLKGKRVVELGAGCGVAGFGMALLGCDVVSTDQIEVVPLLRRNVECNISRIMQMNSNSDSFGSIKVAELDWGNGDHIKAVAPPFDYVIGTDVMDSKYQHPSIQLFIMGLKSPSVAVEKAECAISTEKSEETARDIDPRVNEVEPSKTDQDKEENCGSSSLVDDLPLTRLPDGKLSEWEARRFGSMAARLLRDVKIT
ncbi:hypothetical protein V6N11_057571 [Hibiscus sabdariffa]|uniref:Uncharacterized protein n=2 Tax=Hibiscus sabdariffa TaxID=183260 RepID=A0ABR2BDN3_9ROSI